MKSGRSGKVQEASAVSVVSNLESAADYVFDFSHALLSIKFWLKVKNDEAVLSWRVHKLGKRYPGGSYSLLGPTVEFQDVATAKSVSFSLLPLTSHTYRPRMTGKEGYFRVRGWHMPYFPLTLHFSLSQGDYEVWFHCGFQEVKGLAEYTPAYDGRTIELTKKIGRLILSKSLSRIDSRPINELHYKAPTFNLKRVRTPRFDRGSSRGNVDPECHFEKYLLGTARRILAGGEKAFYPRMEPRFAKLRGAFVQSQRVFAAYCGSLSVAYRLTGRPEYYRASRLSFEILDQNICRTKWGAAIGLQTFREGENLLELGICAQGMYEFFRITRQTKLLLNIHRALRSWPYNEKLNLPFVEVGLDGKEVHPSYPFNMVAVGALAMWLIGNALNDDLLKSRARETVHRFLLPMMEKDGHWKYAFHYEEGMKYPEPKGFHYDLFTKMNLGFLLEFEEWRNDLQFVDAMLNGMRFSLEKCTEERSGFLRWSKEYTSGGGSHFAINHAGLAVGTLALLTKYVDESFLKNLDGTIQFLYSQRDNKRLSPDVDWNSDWMHYHVLLPLLKAREYGINVKSTRGRSRKVEVVAH